MRRARSKLAQVFNARRGTADAADTVNPLYEPLDHERRQIRVLIPLPGQRSDSVACRMKTVSLDDKPEYDAILYVWGDATQRQMIHVNGQDMHVTLSLFLGLRRFRDESKEHPLWVDAVCIDQSNDDEKSKQGNAGLARGKTGSPPGLTDPPLVDKMQIALLAGEDALNLPPCHGDESLTNHLLDKLLSTEKTRRALEEQIATAEIALLDGSFSQFNAFYLLSHLALNKHLHEIVGTTHGDPERVLYAKVRWTVMVFSLWMLLWNPWWHRAWVVQEIILSPKATVTYGRSTMPWPQFSSAVHNFGVHSRTCCYKDYHKLGKADHLVFQAFCLNVEGISAIEYRDWWSELSVRDLLQRTRNRKATLAVDKVYSLLGRQCSRSNILELVPDDRISHSELYRDVAICDTESTGVLQNLEHCEWQLRSEFSSWVPDWTQHLGRNKNTTAITNRCTSMALYNADNLRRGKVAVLDRRILAVEGIFVDGVTEVSEIMAGIGLKHIRSIKELAERHAKENYPADCSRQELFARTMIADCFHRLHFGDEPTPQPRLRRASVKDIEDYQTIWELYLTAEAERDAGRVMPDIFDRAQKTGHVRDSMNFASLDRRFFVTEMGYIGFGPRTMQKRDHVYVLLGSRTPFILRPDQLISPDLAAAMLDLGAPAGLNHSLIGPCFVHGIMDGELVRDRGIELRNIWLV
ncbi:hypothetical protein H2199_005528 [Coniosporium tulheliwenetii]|uniref:Uncharacterized protein n=1 Tax=Coniosporium tulheliwenetii TaxID=3383036 RepID=A0ACC2Z1J7_9PEZI|nr:hypothetical protein H2199_005528 [Cladosporium sp. JES 115]